MTLMLFSTIQLASGPNFGLVRKSLKSVVRLTDHLDMIIAVDWDVKPQTKQIQSYQTKTGLIQVFSYIITFSGDTTREGSSSKEQGE